MKISVIQSINYSLINIGILRTETYELLNFDENTFPKSAKDVINVCKKCLTNIKSINVSINVSIITSIDMSINISINISIFI